MTPTTSTWRWAMMAMATGGLLQLAVATPSHRNGHHNRLTVRDNLPNLPHDPKTTPDCSYWVDVFGTTSCQDVMDQWHVTLAQMTQWNPSLSAGAGNTCVGWLHYVSYCIEAYGAPGPVTTTAAATPTASKFASSATSASGPSPSATWTKRGCYLDSTLSTLAEQVSIPAGEKGMTVGACQAACWAKSYVFAGVEAGNKCYCGNSVRNELASDAATSCTVACSGDSSQQCGGTNRIIVYQAAPVSTQTAAASSASTSSAASTLITTTSQVPVPTETWTPLGCYSDTANPRTLLDQVQVPGGGSAMTVAKCLTACNSTTPSLGHRYEYAGVENGEECWCGSKINNAASNVAGCQTPCRGNATEMCGSGAHINIYQLQRLVPSWLSLGCYTDVSVGPSLRTLAHQVDMAGGASIGACQDACLAASKGYIYAGLERGDQCWCDSGLGPLALPASEGSAACNAPCTADSSEMCGGRDRLSLYLVTLNSGPLTPPDSSVDPTPTATQKPSTETATPFPMVPFPNNAPACHLFEWVSRGDTCNAIIQKASISAPDFYYWNPSFKNDCTGLQPNTFVCIRGDPRPTTT